ncbi:MAG: AMP-binding protein [Betaproteobacteria bacterium]|nr:AMP-binding protein [Betaproteobacteria bacterium]
MSETYNAAERILAQAARLEGKPALVCGGTTLAYGELAALVSRAANAFTGLGIDRGSRVALLVNDSPLYCAAFLGLVKAGAVAIPLNPRLAAADYAYILAEAGIALAVSEREHVPLIAPAAAGAGVRILAARGGQGETLERLLASAADEFTAAPTRREDPAFWLFSSGTTGRPKGVVHSQLGCAHAGKLLREVIGADSSTVVLATSKLFFAYALDNAFLGPLSIGASTILSETWPEPDQVVEQVALHGPDVVFSVPTFYRRLLGLGAARLAPLKAVALFYSAGERLPDAIATAWREALGREIHSCYGMSESFTNALACFPGQQRLSATGVPLGGVQTRLIDAEGREVGAGDPGVLWIRHPSLALGYHNAQATAKAFRDEWFCTGDVFVRDAGGYYYHQGRADELLRVAGQWVKPAEVEEAVLTDLRLREAACAVVPDRDGFERLALFVVPVSPGEGQALAQSRCDQQLPQHSRPKWIRELAELPRTPSGKIQRYKLRELLLAELARRA